MNRVIDYFARHHYPRYWLRSLALSIPLPYYLLLKRREEVSSASLHHAALWRRIYSPRSFRSLARHFLESVEVNWMIRNSIVPANDSDVEFYLLVALRFFEVLLGWYFL